MACKYLDTCALFSNHLADKPQQVEMVMDKYCKNDYSACARYRLSQVISSESVPHKLYPDMITVADQLIANFDKQRRSNSSQTQTLIKNIQPQDIFDFALDLLAESTENVLSLSYRTKEQSLRKFSLWLKTELQNYYARIIQIKINFTGVRSRKRGKNPLTFFLENLRRKKSIKDSTSIRPNKPEEICDAHFQSLKVRVALFKGLKTKSLHPDIIEAIDAILEVEESRYNLGVEGLIKKFNNSLLK